MAINHFKIAWRTIIRNKSFSLLNAAGLAISITAFILMALYIEDELSFDTFHKRAANIYRVADDKQTLDVLLRSAQTAAPVAPALQHEFPDIKQAVRLIHSEALVKYGNKLFEERNLYYADANVFAVFSFDLLKGNAGRALREPNDVVMTASAVSKYFGNSNPIGQVINIDGENMKVTGVIKNVPFNSHLQVDFLASMATIEKKGSGWDWLFTNWYSNQFYTYVLLSDHYNINKLLAQMPAFDARHKEANGDTKHHYAFEKLTDIYLRSDRDNQAGKTGSLSNVYIFSVVAIFLLLIACINFINLSMARAVARAKEVAIKKVLGAPRKRLIAQFLTESFLMTGMALIIALLLVSVLLPSFNMFSGKQLSLRLFLPWHILLLLTLFAVLGLLSGIYPAFVLSGFKPVTALKGKVSASAWSGTTRKGLVVFQFTVSVILIVCSLVVYSQMTYLQQHDLGFKPSQTLVINFEGDSHVKQRLTSIQQQLLLIPGVQQVTASSNVPGDGNADSWSMDVVKKGGDTIHTELPVYCVDYNYLRQFSIPVSAGRSFSEQYAGDSVSSMLINETALRKLGFHSAEEAMDITVGMYPNDAKITGVIKDFHFESLQKEVAPLALRVLPFKYRLLSLKISTDQVQQTVAAIETKWKQMVPERPIEYNFLDENFNKQYDSQIQFGQVFSAFTILAIVIACLGLFGLALFSVQQRTKEIGIRKILGASVASIAATVSQDFIKLAVFSILIASPVAYYFMHQWLIDFAYRVDISIWIFILAGLMAVLVALITISFQAIKAAVANPVKSLRTE